MNKLKLLLPFLVYLMSANLAFAQTESENNAYDATPEPSSSRWGLAAGTGWISDYSGAGQGRMRYLVMPAYHSKFLTIDRQDGAKAHLLTENRFKFSVSFSFLMPTSSKDIPVRHGMPNLNLVLQLGPELQISLYKSTNFKAYLRLPVRFIVATDFQYKLDYLQWTFAPSFRTEYDFGIEYGKIGTRMELDYAAQDYNAYFYSVDAKYATPTRPAYEAKMGLMQYILGLQYSYDAFMPLTLSFATNIYLMNDSANKNSPLLVKNEGYSFLALAVYYF